VNRGKDFENCIKTAFEKVEDVSIDRLHDQTTGYLASSNIADFIIYKYPFMCYMECKSVQGNTLPFSNISDKQWQGLLEKSKIEGVIAGVCVWFIDHDVTRFIPIQRLEASRIIGDKSVNVKNFMEVGWLENSIEIPGRKKRVFFEYDVSKFFNKVQNYLWR
jgi:recombination protein U